jgi:hypothetical protein
MFTGRCVLTTTWPIVLVLHAQEVETRDRCQGRGRTGRVRVAIHDRVLTTTYLIVLGLHVQHEDRQIDTVCQRKKQFPGRDAHRKASAVAI